MRRFENYEALARVARLEDLAQVPQAELKYFDVRGPGGDTLFSPAFSGGPLGPFAGDELVFDTELLPHWLEDYAPYTNGVFYVKQTAIRASGTGPTLLTGNQMILPGYTFTSSDVNRWVNLTGFASPSYNGLVRILGYQGDVATISKTITATQVGASWVFPWVEIDTLPNPGQEPRYFPTCESNIGWTLRRSGIDITSQTSGGYTMRNSTHELVRATRVTSIQATRETALMMVSIIRNGAYNLAQSAKLLDSDFLPLTTNTYGV